MFSLEPCVRLSIRTCTYKANLVQTKSAYYRQNQPTTDKTSLMHKISDYRQSQPTKKKQAYHRWNQRTLDKTSLLRTTLTLPSVPIETGLHPFNSWDIFLSGLVEVTSRSHQKLDSVASLLTIVCLRVRPSDAIYPTRFVGTTSTLGLVQLTPDLIHMKAKMLNPCLLQGHVSVWADLKSVWGITGVTVHYVPLVI